MKKLGQFDGIAIMHRNILQTRILKMARHIAMNVDIFKNFDYRKSKIFENSKWRLEI